jgi:hypothetical protein
MSNTTSNYQSKIIREIQLRNMSASTQAAYLSCASRLIAFTGKEPEDTSIEEVKTFLLYLKNERGLGSNSVNHNLNALKFLFNVALAGEHEPLTIQGRKREHKLPEVLSQNEVKHIIANTTHLRGKVILLLAYSAGLRVSELTRLKPEDIDSQRMLIRVCLGKGAKDRYTVMSPYLLEQLRLYWKKYQPKTWLFPGHEAKDTHITEACATRIWKKAKNRAGITKGRGIHTLRHCFATHLLEAKVNIRTIQVLMGHSSLMTTAVYLKVTPQSMNEARSAMDLLKFY